MDKFHKRLAMADDPNEDESWLYGSEDADATEASTTNTTAAASTETPTTTTVSGVGADGAGGTVQASEVAKRLDDDIDHTDNFMVITTICLLNLI